MQRQCDIYNTKPDKIDQPRKSFKVLAPSWFSEWDFFWKFCCTISYTVRFPTRDVAELSSKTACLIRRCKSRPDQTLLNNFLSKVLQQLVWQICVSPLSIFLEVVQENFPNIPSMFNISNFLIRFDIEKRVGVTGFKGRVVLTCKFIYFYATLLEFHTFRQSSGNFFLVSLSQ